MGWLMDPIYNAISWILLRWHWVWDAILQDGRFLGTTGGGSRTIHWMDVPFVRAVGLAMALRNVFATAATDAVASTRA